MPSTLLQQGLRSLLDLVLPPRCLLCRQADLASDLPFCKGCHAEIFNQAWLACPRCAATVGPFACPDGMCGLCRPNPPPFQAALRLGVHADALQHAILLGKHSWHESLLELLGNELARRSAPLLQANPVDTVVAMPLHWRRRWRQGYNHSQAIAQGMAARLHRPCRTNWLRRLRDTKPQKSLSASERWLNVQGAFQARPAVAGQHILLVDDVMTTSATASAATTALLRAGAARVTIAVLARAQV